MRAAVDHVTETKHYGWRAARRALRREVEEFLMEYGSERWAAGAYHLTSVRKDLPLEVRDSEIAERADGWILVISPDGARITCYHRPDAWRFIRRKSETRRRARSA